MQPLTAAPRDALTTAQVRDLLTRTTVAAYAGCEVLAPDLTVLRDVSGSLGAGTVERTMRTVVHGTCSLDLDEALPWASTLLRPYAVLAAGGLAARFDLGAYVPTAPSRRAGGVTTPYALEGFDRLYLLDRYVGDTYVVPAGTGYLTAVRAAITAAGLTGVNLDASGESKTLPVTRTWPLVPPSEEETRRDDDGPSGPVTWLRVVNDLLAAIGYRGLYADPSGLYRSEPYLAPIDRPTEWAHDVTRADQIVGEARALERDDWDTPNRWTFVRRGLSARPVEGAGLYTVTDTAGVTRRGGLVWPAEPIELDAADQASLVVQGNARVADDLRVAARIITTTGPFPAAGHADVYTVTDPALGLTVARVQGAQWSQGWGQNGLLTDVDHQWELIA